MDPGARRRTRRRRDLPWNRIPMVVVEQHNAALQPVLQGLRSGALPRSGLRLVHFDSHPDLQVAEGECERLESTPTTICSWIAPLLLAGVVAEVWWISAAFCDQIAVGTYHLAVGRSVATGRMKMAAARPEDHDAYDCRKYYGAADAWVPVGQLRDARCFTLHVRRCGADGSLDDLGLGDPGGAPWWLDVDEDFLSCANPHAICLEAWLGAADADLVARIYSHLETPRDLRAMQRIVEGGVYRRDERAFDAHRDVRQVGALLGDAAPLTALRARLRRWYADGSKLLPPRTLHAAAVGATLPHHVASLEEIAALMRTIENASPATPPVLITLACSRDDGFVPAVQAGPIHDRLVESLRRRYKGVTCQDWRRASPSPDAHGRDG